MDPGSSNAPQGGPDLRHSVLRSRIAKLPHLPAIAPHAQEAAAGAKSEDSANGSSSMMPPPSSSSAAPSSSSFSNRARRDLQDAKAGSLKDMYSPRSASDCFEEALDVDVYATSTNDAHDTAIRHADAKEAGGGSESPPDATFRVYYTPPRPKVRRQQSSRTNNISSNGKVASNDLHNIEVPDLDAEEEHTESRTRSQALTAPGIVFLLHHGAGYSALSFALVAKHITDSTGGEAGVLAFDCRGHGKTRHRDEEAAKDLSLATLTNDALLVLGKLFPRDGPQPTLVLVGHSMGGSVVVSLAHALSDGNSPKSPRVAGVSVLDVVEGTAMAALPSMKTIVSSLPPGFDSIEDAIRWHVDSGTIVNLDSARRSVPSLLVQRKPELSSDEVKKSCSSTAQSLDDEHIEELHDGFADNTAQRPASSYAYVWRHNLLATEPHWAGWFAGLSQRFLTSKCARLLLLAGTDRLDKDLMIGQMQGKFQLTVFADVGHSLQEDAPQRTADTLVQFWRRNEAVDIAAVKGLRKVGQ